MAMKLLISCCKLPTANICQQANKHLKDYNDNKTCICNTRRIVFSKPAIIPTNQTKAYLDSIQQNIVDQSLADAVEISVLSEIYTTIWYIVTYNHETDITIKEQQMKWQKIQLYWYWWHNMLRSRSNSIDKSVDVGMNTMLSIWNIG